MCHGQDLENLWLVGMVRQPLSHAGKHDRDPDSFDHGNQRGVPTDTPACFLTPIHGAYIGGKTEIREILTTCLHNVPRFCKRQPRACSCHREAKILVNGCFQSNPNEPQSNLGRGTLFFYQVLILTQICGCLLVSLQTLTKSGASNIRTLPNMH